MKPKHLPRKILLDRERERLDRVAESRGYPNADIMIYDMYVFDKVALLDLAAMLRTPIWTLRKRMVHELGIEIRSRGGRNNVVVELTPELIEEVSREGIHDTAAKLGMSDVALGARLRRWLIERNKQ